MTRSMPSVKKGLWIKKLFLHIRTTEGEHGALEIHDEKYSGKAWTVKVREVLENLEQVRPSVLIKATES
jgi:hypothetical protein